ncbi:uncharacterized protein K02A2.6-like [Uranotaenia lowii]|uniref:uncharacterized protein K02A2.6-like n=1 Tax=Uranotaenia lowii TaxID=190385 RepID=UPI00247AB9F8|nr:uncharacterized protein K02A2.6-like [Uranotaenia lowii]XP_055589401.1 uncharacterized protein K02A2.6-like [Uranotaenia lowii]
MVGNPERPEPMQRRKLPEAPWIDLAIDFLGPLPSGDYLLVIIDYFSRYKEVEIMRKITAGETVERLEKIFTRLGYPKTLTLDNGRQFVSTEFDNYCKVRGITVNRTTPYWPQENGLVERQNRSLVKRLKISQALNRDWKHDLLTYLSMYYSTPHSTTGKTPSELMYGRNVRTTIPALTDLSSAVPCTDYRDRDQLAKQKGKEHEDRRRRAKLSELVVGDKVYMKNVLPGNKLTPTFDNKVLTVKSKQGPRVTVQNDETGKLYERNSTHLKKILIDNSLAKDNPVDDDGSDTEDFRGFPDESGNNDASPSPSTAVVDIGKRNKRQRKITMPKRLDDCLMKF